MTSAKLQLRQNLRRDAKYRNAFVCEHVDQNIPFQIRANREHRGWTQAELGNRAGMAQARISTLEDPNYSRFTISTLKRLAAAFDTGLQVAFVPVSEVLNRSVNLRDHLISPSADEDDGLDEESSDTPILASAVRPQFEPQFEPDRVSTIYYSYLTGALREQTVAPASAGMRVSISRPSSTRNQLVITNNQLSGGLGTATAAMAAITAKHGEVRQWNC